MAPRTTTTTALLSFTLLSGGHAFSVVTPPPPPPPPSIQVVTRQLPFVALDMAAMSGRQLLGAPFSPLSSNLLSTATIAPNAASPMNTAPKTISPPVATNTAKPVASSASSTGRSSNILFIADLRYNGNVPKTEADEYIVLTNGGKAGLDISGYYIYVATNGSQGATYTFPKKTAPVAPNASVRVYTNEIHKESGGFTFNSGKAIWNNKGGLAVLKDSSGKKLGEFKYAP